jgi:two-component system, cell cycle sensor histidine kinase and response regulator CckA
MQSGEIFAAWTSLKATIRKLWSGPGAPHEQVILVAESNRVLRRLLISVLRAQDYRTIEARNGGEAVRIGARYRHDIHLLVTDVRLPDLIGWELGELIRLDHPALRVVCMGYNAADRRRQLGRTISRFVLLQTPFRREPVINAVRQELNEQTRLSRSGLKLVEARCGL